MPSLNNEVDIITVGGVDQDIRDTTTRSSIGPTEPLDVASQPHRINEVFYLAEDRKLYRATQQIEIGHAFMPGINVEEANLADLMYRLFNQSPEEVMEDIATYERTETASKTFHAGDRIFLMDGTFCRVTDTVYEGTTWAIGTNCELSDTITDLILALEQGKQKKLVRLEQLLESNQTTVVFTDNAIPADASDNTKILRPATNMFGKMPLTMTLTAAHEVTMTFKAQTASMVVYLIIEEV